MADEHTQILESRSSNITSPKTIGVRIDVPATFGSSVGVYGVQLDLFWTSTNHQRRTGKWRIWHLRFTCGLASALWNAGSLLFGRRIVSNH